jgi:hypothetical protein
MQEKRADAIHRMYEVAGLNLKTAARSREGVAPTAASGRGAEGWHEVSGLTDAGAPTVNPKQLSIVCESVDNHGDG